MINKKKTLSVSDGKTNLTDVPQLGRSMQDRFLMEWGKLMTEEGLIPIEIADDSHFDII